MNDPSIRLRIFAGILNRLGRVPLVDLGAGHCKFAMIAHAQGFPVTAIDVRTERVPADLPFPFIHQDVRHADLSPYGIVCILGLLYHLPLPEQFQLLGACRGKIVIVDTHCAERAEVHLADRRYEGRYFEEKLDDPRASWGNKLSFWHTEPSLRQMFADLGFKAEKVLPEHVHLRSFWLLRSASDAAV
jgi:hypothetical protein